MLDSLADRARRHPLGSVLLIASLPRLVAVVWSKGFMHLDDYYDTVRIAYDWSVNGLWGPDGHLRWGHNPSGEIYRFPVYNLLLYGLIQAHRAAGIDSLDAMLYTNRLLHALASLVPVWAAYRIAETATNATRWAVFAGLAVGLHFALPLLGVRNLIEMVSGSVWMAALYGLYRYRSTRDGAWLVAAGAATGLAWMIRFQIVFAALPVPLVLWRSSRSVRPALVYSLSFLLMVLMAGVMDGLLLGRFAGSTARYLQMNAGQGAMYGTIPLLYLAILAIALLPPLSPWLLAFMARRDSWRGHPILAASSGAFLLTHSALPFKQERFIFLIVPAFILMAVLALHAWTGGDLSRLQRTTWFRRLAIPALVLNGVLLVVVTPSYIKRGLVEPFVEIGRRDPDATVLVIQPGMRYFVPDQFQAPHAHGCRVRRWEEMVDLRERYAGGERYDYVVTYPLAPGDRAAIRDSVESVVGGLKPLFTVEPSLYDRVLHGINPKHNFDFRAEVYAPAAG